VRMKLRFHGEALAELVDQAVYYESKSTGLGERFAAEVRAATEIAREFPEMGAPFKQNCRRVFPRKFPFSVVYRVLADEIVILAVAPDARKPDYWRRRTTNPAED
jgi:toxin ParE1/3/4